jgi:hypothetical protein
VKQSLSQWILIYCSLFYGLLVLLLATSPLGAAAYHPQTACENSFAGAVYFDQNRDGIRNSNELYLPGQIAIIDAQGAIQQTIESQDGIFSAQQLACNTYQIQHNHLTVGLVVVGEVMTQELRMFPKAQTLFFPVVAAQ